MKSVRAVGVNVARDLDRGTLTRRYRVAVLTSLPRKRGFDGTAASQPELGSADI